MNVHPILGEEELERAALYSLGALDPDAAKHYAVHLEICAACQAEVNAHRAAVEALGRAVEPVTPPPSLKARLMDVARTPHASAPIQSWKQWAPSAMGEAMTIVRGDGAWETTGIDGVAVRRLFVDTANDRLTMLVRMAAGTSYPAHRHGGVEECYVLEGDLYGPNFEMQAGDYQRLDGGSVHGVQGTRGGCLLFIVSSMNDELLSSRP